LLLASLKRRGARKVFDTQKDEWVDFIELKRFGSIELIIDGEEENYGIKRYQ
jgi:hypothetical protein